MRQRGELVPIGEVVSGLDDVLAPAFDLSLVLALAAALPGPRPRHRRRSC